MLLNKNITGLAILGAITLALSGCGEAKVVPVTGTLTYKGNPVPNVYVHFVPENGRPSMGQTDAQGRFTLAYDPQTKGVQRGKHKVWIQRNPIADPSAPGATPGMPGPPPAELKELFDKYSADNSKFAITIDKEEKDLKVALD
jgi:hypothetical protein